MRRLFNQLVALAFAAAFLSPTVGAVDGQQQVAVIRRQPASSVNAYVRVTDHGGKPYLSITQVAVLLDAHLRWRPVAKEVDLAVRGRNLRFQFNSDQLTVDGRREKLPAPTVKDSDGLWIPAEFVSGDRFQKVTGARLKWPEAERPDPSESALAPVARPPAVPKPLVVAKKPGMKREAAAISTIATPKPLASYGKALKRIVVDPGHGGKDPGTVGVKGTEEKTLNLLFAQDLAEVLRGEGYEVILTRTDDTFIPLSKRAELANRYNADLFLSVHCNASLSPKLKGLEVYFLSERASDPHADAVARAENAALALEGKSIPSQGQLQAVLRSLVKNANINESSALGAMIDHHVGRELGRTTLGVKQAGFYVLRDAEMPSVLIETGFLTNKGEEKDLLSKSYRRRLIRGILEAVRQFDERKQKDRSH